MSRLRERHSDRQSTGRWSAVFTGFIFSLLLVLCACVNPSPSEQGTGAQKSLPQYVEPFNGKNLVGWQSPTGAWQVVGDVIMDASTPEALALNDGEGVLVNGLEGRTSNLLSNLQHADVELSLEFMVPKASNSGIYLQGRYEVQILDSWQIYEPSFGDCGGIYQRYVDGKGFEGTPPRINAALPPGAWQRFDITFRAPRFDSLGRKVENARFVKVVHNGVVIHENVEVTGPTRAASFGDEKPWGPLMIQGDHGPVAYRNIVIRHQVIP